MYKMMTVYSCLGI